MPSHSPSLFQQPWPEGEFRFFQLGFIVDDAVAAARRWAEVFGVGPFHVLDVGESPCIYRGVPAIVDLQIAVAQAGPVQIELIAQLCDNDSVYRELERSGPAGFHQVCTVVDDYDATLDRYRSLGLDVVCEFRVETAPPVAYVDTLTEFGFFTEVVQRTDAFLEHLTEVAEAGANWDGTDPIRLPAEGGGHATN